MPTPDDVLQWIRPSLEAMEQDYHADPAKPWEERREFFLHQLGLHDASQDPVVEELLQRLDQESEEERDRILGGDELDSMASELVLQHYGGQGDGGEAAQGGQPPSENAAAYDEQAWQAFLAQNGPQWDGTDASWDQFRQWFEYHAGQQGLGVPAAALLDYLATQPAAERIATFAQYGVTIQSPQTAAGGDAAAYDEQAWQAFLAQNGPQWDGTDASWDQFRQWFEYHAGQQGLGVPAAALLDYLATQPAAERIATFAQYGVTIAAAPEAAAPETAAPERAAPEAAAPDAAAPEAAAGEVSAEQIESIGEDALAAHPEYADMSEAESTEIISNVLDQLEAI